MDNAGILIIVSYESKNCMTNVELNGAIVSKNIRIYYSKNILFRFLVIIQNVVYQKFS